jgi:hypothetical protein
MENIFDSFVLSYCTFCVLLMLCIIFISKYTVIYTLYNFFSDTRSGEHGSVDLSSLYAGV